MGAFLIPYFISIVMCGIPLFMLEVSVGQYLSTGGIGIWNLVPILKGIGFASMVMIALCNIYYIVLIAYTMFYLVASFHNPLPWERCHNWWNTDLCYDGGRNLTVNQTLAAVSPVKEYWEPYLGVSRRNVLQITGGLEEIGGIRLELLAYLLLAWVLVYFVIWRGLHQSGKVGTLRACHLMGK
ncbi:SLC6A1, partial [Cordylochernes scorpioides]